MIAPLTKRCSRCRKIKPLVDFHMLSMAATGRTSRCKDCQRLRSPKWRRRLQESLTGLKVCVRCGQTKPLAAFLWHKLRKLYYAQCRDCMNATQRCYRNRNPMMAKRASKKWQTAHPQVMRLIQKRRKARKRGALGTHTLAEWLSLKALFGFKCLKCGRPEPEIKLTEDHIVPLVKGGTNYIDNIQPLCVSCNSSKRQSVIDYRPAHSVSP